MIWFLPDGPALDPVIISHSATGYKRHFTRFPCWNFHPPQGETAEVWSFLHRKRMLPLTSCDTRAHSSRRLLEPSMVYSLSKLYSSGSGISHLHSARVKNNTINMAGGNQPSLSLMQRFICPDSHQSSRVVGGVYWTYECSCRWSRIGSDTSGAPQHRPHHPATQVRVSLWGTQGTSKEEIAPSGRREVNQKAINPVRHTSSMKIWVQDDRRKLKVKMIITWAAC